MATVSPELDALLSRVESDAARHFDEAVRVVVVTEQERPFSRLKRLAVLRPGQNTPFAHLFVKTFKSRSDLGEDALQQRIASDYEANTRAHTALLRRTDLGAVPPVACYPEWLTVVTEEVSGPTLLEHLQVEAAWFVGPRQLRALECTMRAAGQWVKVFQGTASGGSVSRSSFHAYIGHRLDRLVAAGSRRARRNRADVLRHVDALADNIPSQELREVAVHSDLALGNVLVSQDGIVVLDFAMAKLGTRLHDITRLWLQLEMLSAKPRFRPRTIQHLQDALLQGYDPDVAPDQPLFRLLVLLHRINQLTKMASRPVSVGSRMFNSLSRRRHWARVFADLRVPPSGGAS